MGLTTTLENLSRTWTKRKKLLKNSTKPTPKQSDLWKHLPFFAWWTSKKKLYPEFKARGGGNVTNLLILYLLFVTCHTLNGAQHVLSTAFGRSVPRALQYLFRLWPDVLIEHLYYAFLDCTDLNRSR